MSIGQSTNCFKCVLSTALTAGGSETTFYVDKLTTMTGETITTSVFSKFGKGVLTIDPLSSTNIEFASFTGVDGTAISFTGGSRGLSAFDYTASSSRAKYHPVGTTCIIAFGTHNLSDILTYIDSFIAGSIGNASSTVAGITKLTQNPTSPTIPIAVGSNTSASGTDISTSNKAVDVAYLSTVIPPGVIWPYAGSSAPSGWLNCDGSAVSRSTYAALFSAISTAYGTGNGTTTFNIPDLRGRTLIGSGTGTSVFTFSSRSSDTITVTGSTNSSTNNIQTGQIVTYHTSGSVITGLTNDTTYYLIRVAYNQFKLASSLANAQNGTQISLSSDGTGTQTFTLTLTARSVGDYGGEETHAMSITELLAHTHTTSIQFTTGSGSSTGSYGNGGTTGSTGGNVAMNNMQPFGTSMFIIKT